MLPLEILKSFAEELYRFTLGRSEYERVKEKAFKVSKLLFEIGSKDNRFKKTIRREGIENCEQLSEIIVRVSLDYAEFKLKHQKTHGRIFEYSLKSLFKDMSRYVKERFGENLGRLMGYLTKLI